MIFIDSVDDDILPARVLVRLKQEAEGGERRRSSFMERVSARVEEPTGEDGLEQGGTGGDMSREELEGI